MAIHFVLLFLIFIYRLLFLEGSFFKNKKYFLFFSFLSIALVVGLRGSSVGEDTIHYSEELYNVFLQMSWKAVLTHPEGVVWSIWGESIEYLFAILYKLVQLFKGSGQVFILVVALITCNQFARFIYRNINKHVFFATLVFLLDSLYMGAFNGIRQMLALSIAINAYEYVEKKEYKKAFLIILVAFFIHSSAIIMLPFLMLHFVKNYRKGVVIIVAVSIVAPLSINVVAAVVTKLIPKYSAYFMENYWTNSIKGTLILWAILIVLIVYLFAYGIKNKDEFFGIMGAILYMTVELMGLRISAFTRITYYFRVFLLMFFPACGMRFSKKSRNIYYLVIFLLLLAEYISYASVPSRQYVFADFF